MSRVRYLAKAHAIVSACGVIASCGQSGSQLNQRVSSVEGIKNESEVLDPSIGLTNGAFYFSDIVRHNWFIANADGTSPAGYTRPVNFDKSFASIVSIEDLGSKQVCTGTRVAERAADGSLSVWIVTAAHCFVSNTPFGMRASNADTQKNLRIYRYFPYVQPGSAINTNWTGYFRLYRRESMSSAAVVSPKKVLQLGSGDIVKILVSENVSQIEVDSTTQSLCKKEQLGSAFPVTGSPIGKLAVGAYKDPSNGLWQTPVLIGDSLMQIANQETPWNRNPQVMNLVSSSSIEFGANQKFDLGSSLMAITAGHIPSPMVPSPGSADDSIYSFTHFKKNSGVTAGDSGVPVFETSQSASNATALNCVSGVVVREFWSNPYGSAGGMAGSIARRIGGMGAGIEPTTIIHKISDHDNLNWSQVFPNSAVGNLRAGLVGTTEVKNSAVVQSVRTDLKLESGIVIRPEGIVVLPDSNRALPRKKISAHSYQVSFQTKPNVFSSRTFFAIKDVSRSGVTDRELNECISLLNHFKSLPVQVKIRCSLDSVALLEFDLRANSTRISLP